LKSIIFGRGNLARKAIFFLLSTKKFSEANIFGAAILFGGHNKHPALENLTLN